MLDTTQVNELREKDFYNSTYKIPYNIKFYKEIKRPKNCFCILDAQNNFNYN